MFQSVTWITAYDAAGAIVDALSVDNAVLHLVHPKPVLWSSIIATFSKILGLSVVPYSEWLDALEAAHTALESGSANAAEVERAIKEKGRAFLLSNFLCSSKRVAKGAEGEACACEPMVVDELVLADAAIGLVSSSLK